MLDKLKTFVSKKLLITVLTAALVYANNRFQLGMDEATINRLVLLVVGYVIGQAAVDVAAVITPTAPNPPSVGGLAPRDYPVGNGGVIDSPAPVDSM